MKELKIIEFKNERIITTKLLSEKYECNETQITQNFNNHLDRFEEGKHYHLLQGEELKEFKRNIDNIDVAQNVNKLYLWTEKGILRHAKILDTEKAWDMYEELEETYFKVQEIKNNQLNADMSKQIAEIVQAQLQDQFNNQIEKVNNTYSKYYRPTALTKRSISDYIKRRLGINTANDEYELVKRRILIVLGAKQWQDVPIEVLQSSLDKIDECIDIVRKDRPYQQTTML